MTIGNAIRHGLSNLTRFDGRDAGGTFWPYAIALFLSSMLLSMIGMIPLVTGALDKMQRFAAEHPDQVTVSEGPGSYSMQIRGDHPEFFPDFTGFIVVLGIVITLVILLLAAAVVRRLHDTGRSGYWGLLPAPFLAFGLAGFAIMMARFGTGSEPPFVLFGAVFLNNLIYLGALFGLVALLLRRGTAGLNRYGEPPIG